ncbi:MAG: hypothetical protein M3018_13445 [Actinomycetota bacterium]|nr:hypothetical protein [Actinomycetota bacterium]
MPLTWPVSDQARENLVVRWPSRYGWPNAGGWIDPIKRGIGSHVRIEYAEIPQPVGNVVAFEAVDQGRKHSVLIDYDDRVELHECASGAELYFKLQFSRDGYGRDRVCPGGYVSKKPALYRHAGALRQLRERRPPEHDVVGRFGIRSESAREIRGKAIAMLSSQKRFGFTGGGQPVWWGEYIDELSDARVCLDLPGRGELCYRLVECLALGACVIGPELDAQLHVPLESGVHLIRLPRSLEGLLEWCERLIADEDLRSTLGRGAAEYFDRYLALEQLGAYYVDALWRLCQRP